MQAHRKSQIFDLMDFVLIITLIHMVKIVCNNDETHTCNTLLLSQYIMRKAIPVGLTASLLLKHNCSRKCKMKKRSMQAGQWWTILGTQATYIIISETQFVVYVRFRAIFIFFYEVWFGSVLKRLKVGAEIRLTSDEGLDCSYLALFKSGYGMNRLQIPNLDCMNEGHRGWGWCRHFNALCDSSRLHSQ